MISSLLWLSTLILVYVSLSEEVESIITSNHSQQDLFTQVFPSRQNNVDYSPGDRLGGLGYFNYNPNDFDYGPGKAMIEVNEKILRYPQSKWPFIIDTLEEKYWRMKYPDIIDDLDDWQNECWWNGRQSPIDLCDDKVNKGCRGNVIYNECHYECN